MRELLRKYNKILRVELEELVEDLKIILESHHQKKQKGSITEYVFRENITVIKHEIAGFKHFLEALDKLDIDKYESLPDMINDIDGIFKKMEEDYDFPEAVYILTRRKLNKVSRYIQNSL